MLNHKSDLKFPHIMLDLETTGTNAAHNAIIQIAAVRFNLYTGDVDLNMFNRCLMMPKGKFWDQSTYDWWAKRVEVYQSIMARAEDPRVVMNDFATWIGTEQLQFFGKPTHFDFNFIQEYVERFLDRPTMFHFRHATDMNSWIRGVYFPEPVPDLRELVPMEGPAHDAIFDTLYQIKQLFYVAKYKREREAKLQG